MLKLKDLPDLKELSMVMKFIEGDLVARVHHVSPNYTKLTKGIVRDVGKRGALVAFLNSKEQSWVKAMDLYFVRQDAEGREVPTRDRPIPPNTIPTPMPPKPETPPRDDEDEENTPMALIPKKTEPLIAPAAASPTMSQVDRLRDQGIDPFQLWVQMGQQLLSGQEKAVQDALATSVAAQSELEDAKKLLAEAESRAAAARAAVQAEHAKLDQLKKTVQGK